MKLIDADGMREADRRSIEEFCIPGILLMENAGKAAYDLLARRFPSKLSGGVLIVAGKGNNGGDGFVIARYLQAHNYPVKVCLVGRSSELPPDALQHLNMAVACGVGVEEVATEDRWAQVSKTFSSYALLVDALLGTGLKREITGLYHTVVKGVNDSALPVFSVDIPSGVDASTGQVLGIAVQAECTGTFGVLKTGIAMGAGFEQAGSLEALDIGLPKQATADLIKGRVLTASWVAHALPERPEGAHKGTFGHLLVVAGSLGKVGAAIMCAMAALRSGVGLVTLAVPAALSSVNYPPELMVELLPDDSMGHLTTGSIETLKSLSKGKSALAIGPGLGTAPGVGEAVMALLNLNLPTVVDADGLNNLVGEPLEELCGPHIVLTPHPGEMGRLIERSSFEVEKDRLAAVKRLQAMTGSVALLKGRRTLIYGPAGLLHVNPTGNSGMGTGGSGDILTGIIGAFLAQGTQAETATCLAAYLHGMCGDITMKVIGGRALIATDLIDNLGSVFCAVEEAS